MKQNLDVNRFRMVIFQEAKKQVGISKYCGSKSGGYSVHCIGD